MGRPAPRAHPDVDGERVGLIGVRLRCAREALDAAARDAVLAIHALALGYARTGAGWSDYARELTAAAGGPLAEAEVLAGFPRDPDSPAWRHLALLVDLDPLPSWRRGEVPALFLLDGEGPPYGLLLFGENGHAHFREDALDFLARWIRGGGAGRAPRRALRPVAAAPAA